MTRFLKFFLGVAAVVAWLAFALSPKGGPSARAAGPPDLDDAGPEVTELRGEMLVRDDALGMPSDAAMAGRWLVLADRAGAAPFHAIDPANGRLTSFGTEGEGPGEFEAPWSLDPVPSRSAFWAWDIALQRLTLVELDDGVPAAPLRSSRTLALRSPGGVTGMVAVADDRWLGLGAIGDGRLAEFDATGLPRGTRGEVPGLGTGHPAAVLQQAYLGPITARPDRRTVAVGARYAGRLELHGVAAGDMRLAQAPLPFEPTFGVRETPHGPVMATGDDARFGYIDVAAAPGGVYALFSGRTPAGRGERAHYADRVHVFDWAGTFRGALRLEADAIAVAVDEVEGALYAVSHHPVPTVWRYRLPGSLVPGG